VSDSIHRERMPGTLVAPFVATLPTGERVRLPAGTVLVEGTEGLDLRHLLACARGVVDHNAAHGLVGPIARGLLGALRTACGDSIEDVALRVGPVRATDKQANISERIKCRHGLQSKYIKDGAMGCEDCDAAAWDTALARHAALAEEQKTVEVVEVPGLEQPPTPDDRPCWFEEYLDERDQPHAEELARDQKLFEEQKRAKGGP
jgi:hypothetical protein